METDDYYSYLKHRDVVDSETRTYLDGSGLAPGRRVRVSTVAVGRGRAGQIGEVVDWKLKWCVHEDDKCDCRCDEEGPIVRFEDGVEMFYPGQSMGLLEVENVGHRD